MEQFCGCSVHLTEQTDQPKPTIFPKCRTSHSNGVNVILKYGKGGGRGSRTSLRQLRFYFDASLPVIHVSFFLFLFAWLFVSSFFSAEGNNLSMDGISYYLFVCWRLFVQRRSFLRSFLRQQREMLRVAAVGLLHCHMAIKKFLKNKSRCYNSKVSHVIV